MYSPFHHIAMMRELRESRKLSLDVLDKVFKSVWSSDPSTDAWSKGYFRTHRRRMALDLALCQRFFPADARVLEIGSVPPFVTLSLAAFGYEVVGVDIEPKRFAECINPYGDRLRLYKCDIERQELPFEDSTFGCVVMNEVLEHLHIDPVFSLGEVRRITRCGGILLLSTPNLRSYRGIYNLVFGHRGLAVGGGGPLYQWRKLTEIGHMGHIREYTMNHNYEGCRLPYDHKMAYKPVTIGRNVWIGMNVIILPGAEIGDGAIVGAGSCVRGLVRPLAIVAPKDPEVLKLRDEDRYRRLERQQAYGGVNGEPLGQ